MTSAVPPLPSVVPSSLTAAHVPSSLAPAPPVLLPVQTPSGQVISVLGPEEQFFYDEQNRKYTSEFAYTNVSDLLDLDQLLFHELMIFRLTKWIAGGRDYDGFDIDLSASRKALKETSELANKVKTSLGITKSQRDKEKAESVGAFLITLKQRAKEFGIHREKQLGKALELINQMFSIVGSFDRADEVEREKLGFPDEHSILEWIRETMRPQYDEVDAHFRQNQQRNWIKDL